MSDKGKALRQAISPQQQRFCEEYAEGGNITEAAKAAGYSPRSAHAQGSRLLKDVKVSEYVDWLREQTEQEKTLSRRRKRELLRNIAEGEILETKVSDRVKAIQLDNLMTGHNAPQKVEGDISITEVIKSLPRTTGLPYESNTED